MERKLIDKTITYICLPVLILVIAMLCTSFSFADDTDPTAVNTSSETIAEGSAQPSSTVAANINTKKSTNKQTRVFSHAITNTDIKKYGKYKGRNATRIPVITYHQIVTDKQKKSKKYRNDNWSISESTFKQHMRYLHSKQYKTINCDEFYLWYTGKIKLPKRTVLITFDDSNKVAAKKALPVLKKYKMKGTFFIIGKHVHGGGTRRYFSEKFMMHIHEEDPNVEFQSHTYNLHYFAAIDKSYKVFYNDAKKMNSLYGFNYLAYPYGAKNSRMIRAFKNKNSGIRMAFSFGDYGYATRDQSAYSIKRFGIKGHTTFREFRSWCN